MDARSAAEVLKLCCGSARWAEEMSARRPFSDINELHRTADLVWQALDREDWNEAFASHPKIGEIRNLSAWSKNEQEGMATAADNIRACLAELNREYQERFGFIFIVCATGKSAQEMLTSIEQRLQNSPDDERQVAGQEQAKIVHLRLNKLVHG
ncbi:MAG: 2-oxo-4-hydroxy-4-carboxy-5-ureidoimidazoline decarboxylase [Bryobacteraceae bacterium]